MSEQFLYTKYIGKEVEVEIDRPLGSKHPKCEIVYDLNYGYVPGTRAGDGEEIDVYVLHIKHPIKKVKAKCIAIVCRYDDVENKLILSDGIEEYTDNQILEMIQFNEKFFDSIVVRNQTQYQLFLIEKKRRLN